ncbi:MAG: ROK family protein [Bacteroidota bacterium]
MSDLTVGVDLGGTKIAAALVGPEDRILAEDRRPTEAERGVETVVGKIVEAVRQVAGGDLGRVTAIGLGAPGPLNCRKGLVHKAPNLSGWDNVPIVRLLEDRLGIHTVLENDANAAGYGEWAAGAGKGTRDMIYLTISTGIGGGLIVGGRIHHGRDDGAGEVGHMTVVPDGPPCGCGRRGCWETLCSGTGIAAAMVRKLAGGAESRVLALAGGDPKNVTSAHVAQAAREGDPAARAVFDEALFYMALGLTNLIHLLNPEMVVIGGGVAKLGDQLFVPLREMVKKRAYPALVENLPIVPAALGDRAGVLGAAMVARIND